jgi:hypothetical protein
MIFRRYDDPMHWIIEIPLTPWRRQAYCISHDEMRPLRRCFFFTWYRRSMNAPYWGHEVHVRFGVRYA